VTINYTSGTGGTLVTTAGGERLFTVSLTVTNQSQTAGLSWDAGNSALIATPGTFTTNVFTGSNNAPLPIQLALFSAEAVKNSAVTLKWSTASEVNNYGFEVQRSSTSVGGFAPLSGAFIAGNGTTTVPHDYTYTDGTAGGVKYYYRLRQIDLDGTFHFTDPIMPVATGEEQENVPSEFALEQNYPNPFNPTTVVEFSLPRESRVTIDLFNILGQKVMTLLDETRSAGTYRVPINGSAMASGIYLYRMTAGGKSFMHKTTLVK
jgi:hypothetical protein